MPEINPVAWDVFRPTMRVVMCPALPYPLIFTSKNLFPEQKQKTSSTCSYSHFPPCYTIPKRHIFGTHSKSALPLIYKGCRDFRIYQYQCLPMPFPYLLIQGQRPSARPKEGTGGVAEKNAESSPPQKLSTSKSRF